MRIKDKIFMDKESLIKEGPITIVAFGDSITHGALSGCINYETVYWNILKKKLNSVRDYVPVNVINAGIGATCAKDSIQRLEKQVLCHNPDLIIVCFGLNDENRRLEEDLTSLEKIFTVCRNYCDDVIFMTPNMLNTYVAKDTSEEHIEYAKKTAYYQNSGKMDLYINSAIDLALKNNIDVCDCYSKWKELSKTKDITKLLINRINHPTPEMHKLFADELFKIIFKDIKTRALFEESTMYE